MLSHVVSLRIGYRMLMVLFLESRKLLGYFSTTRGISFISNRHGTMRYLSSSGSVYTNRSGKERDRDWDANDISENLAERFDQQHVRFLKKIFLLV